MSEQLSAQILDVARRCNVSQLHFEQLKANINATNERKMNLILLAIASGNSRDELEEIVRLGVNWKDTDIQEQTVLHWAAFSGNVDAVNYFVELGADVNARNVWGGTPLHEIGWCTHTSSGIEILRVLVQNGAHINATDNNGKSVLEFAKSKNRSTELINEMKKLGGR